MALEVVIDLALLRTWRAFARRDEHPVSLESPDELLRFADHVTNQQGLPSPGSPSRR